MNRILYKIILLLFFWISIAVNAQDSKSEASKALNTQTLCDRVLKNYTVNEGKTDSGNTYTWTLADTSNNDFSGKIKGQNSNSISIDWADESFTIGETYKLTVVESNNVCVGEKKELSIALTTGYEIPIIDDSIKSVCNGANIFFSLKNGTPQGIVTYNITSDKGYNANSETIKLDDNGAATISIPNLNNAENQEIFTLTLISIDDDGSDSCSSLDINNSKSITVLPIPNTSEISFD